MTVEPYQALLALIGGVIAWTGLGLTNWRFRSERALVVIARIERDARNDVRLTIANIGGRPAMDVVLSAAEPVWQHVAHGVAAGGSFVSMLPVATGRISLSIRYVDADLQLRRVTRQVDLGEFPSLIDPGVHGGVRRFFARLGFVSWD